MARPKKEEVAEENKTNTSDILKTVLKANSDYHFNFEKDIRWKCSTGSLLLDAATGGITPSLVRLCGPNNEGKTPQALEIMRNFMESAPNARGFWVLAEARLSQENRDRCGLKFVNNPEEWTDGTVFIFETNIYEVIIDTIKTLVKNNPNKNCFCFVIDSMDGLVRKDDSDLSAGDSHKVAGPQLLSKKLFQTLSHNMIKYGHLMIAISQQSTEIKIDPYAKNPPRGGSGNFSGGNALLHWADFILEFKATSDNDYILDNPSGKLKDGKSKSIGKFCKVVLEKSTREKSRKQLIQYPIKFGKRPSGVWVEQEIYDLLFNFDLVKSSGAWTYVKEELLSELKGNGLEVPEKFNGSQKLKDFLEESPQVTTYLYNKFKAFIS